MSQHSISVLKGASPPLCIADPARVLSAFSTLSVGCVGRVAVCPRSDCAIAGGDPVVGDIMGPQGCEDCTLSVTMQHGEDVISTFIPVTARDAVAIARDASLTAPPRALKRAVATCITRHSQLEGPWHAVLENPGTVAAAQNHPGAERPGDAGPIPILERCGTVDAWYRVVVLCADRTQAHSGWIASRGRSCAFAGVPGPACDLARLSAERTRHAETQAASIIP